MCDNVSVCVQDISSTSIKKSKKKKIVVGQAYTEFKLNKCWSPISEYYTLSPISEINIKENAAVKPDFASAGKIDEGPFFKIISNKNAKVHEQSTRAIGKR